MFHETISSKMHDPTVNDHFIKFAILYGTNFRPKDTWCNFRFYTISVGSRVRRIILRHIDKDEV